MQAADSRNELRREVVQLLAGQSLAVLATHASGQPYCNLVAFAMVGGLEEIVFATTRATRKCVNLSKDPRVSFLIDNRSGSEEDLHEAMAATAVGVAEELEGEEHRRYVEVYLARHPHMTDFISSPSCAVLRVCVETYYVVRRFQNVMELHMKP